jgi:RNA recognition motif-containing protein
MGKKIFVSNLSFSVDQNQLTDLFAEFGTVDSVKIIENRDTGRSKGFGFVEMSSDAEAEAAINKLNGQEFLGRTLNIAEARPQEPRSGGGGGGGRRFGGDRR